MARRRTEGFAEFVALRSPALQRTAYQVAGDATLAEDLVQEALTRTCLAWGRLRDPLLAESFARKVIATIATDLPGLRGLDAVGERAWVWRDPLAERAGSVEMRPPDLAAITAEAERRARRRRTRVLTVSAVVTAAAVVAAGSALLGPGRQHEVRPDPGTDPVTWSRGSVIHAGPDRVEAGFAVRGFVRTSAGFVLMDDEHTVWSLTDAGEWRVGKVGDQRRLVADRHGTLAAWADPSGRLVVLDQLTGTTHVVLDRPGGDGDDLGVLAMDGRRVYWRDGRGVVTVDAATGAVRPLAGDRLQLFDVRSGVLAFTDAAGDLRAGRSPAGARSLQPSSAERQGSDEPVSLSPTGRWAAVAHIRVTGSGDDQDIDARLRVYDVRTGDPTALDLPGGPWVAVPSVWLGDATLQVLGLFGDPPFQGDTADPALFSCVLPSGSCTKVVAVGRVGAGTAVSALPDGRWASGG
jgi:hypothetical protein